MRHSLGYILPLVGHRLTHWAVRQVPASPAHGRTHWAAQQSTGLQLAAPEALKGVDDVPVAPKIANANPLKASEPANRQGRDRDARRYGPDRHVQGGHQDGTGYGRHPLPVNVGLLKERVKALADEMKGGCRRPITTPPPATTAVQNTLNGPVWAPASTAEAGAWRIQGPGAGWRRAQHRPGSLLSPLNSRT